MIAHAPSLASPLNDVGGPHWATAIATDVLDRARATDDQHAAADAHAAQLTAALRSSGLVWIDRLEAELVSIAAAVNTRVGRLMITTGRTLNGSVSLRAATGAYVMFAFGFAHHDPDARAAGLEVIVQPDTSAGWRTTLPYNVDTNTAGALVIQGLELGPEAFAQVVCDPWLRTLPLAGR